MEVDQLHRHPEAHVSLRMSSPKAALTRSVDCEDGSTCMVVPTDEMNAYHPLLIQTRLNQCCGLSAGAPGPAPPPPGFNTNPDYPHAASPLCSPASLAHVRTGTE